MIEALDDDEKPTAMLFLGDASFHDGPGWYYVDDEYRDEGCCGAFTTENEAIDHAEEAGYIVGNKGKPLTLPASPR
jgi:hypothetical protein